MEKPAEEIVTYAVFVTTIDGRRIKLEAGVGRDEAESIRDGTFGVFRDIEIVEERHVIRTAQ